MRAKLICQSVKHFNGTMREAYLTAVTDDSTPENERYHAATPTANLTIHVSNPAVADFLKPGTAYYLDFTEAV